MKRGRFTEDQIIGVLKEHQAGIPTAELCLDIWPASNTRGPGEEKEGNRAEIEKRGPSREEGRQERYKIQGRLG